MLGDIFGEPKRFPALTFCFESGLLLVAECFRALFDGSEELADIHPESKVVSVISASNLPAEEIFTQLQQLVGLTG